MAKATSDDQLMITTLDNPYNPFTQYEEWLALDTARGYNSPGLLARYVYSSDELSDADQANAISQGIDELIKENPYGMYRKVTPEDFLNES
jgi:hypothetical protein